MVSEGTHGEGEVGSSLGDDVALLSEQAQQQVRGVPGPTEDPGALQPVRHVTLGGVWKQHRYQSEVEAALPDKLVLDLVVNVLGVQAVLVLSVTLHILLVPGADDDDDEHGFIVQIPVHPFGDGHLLDCIIKNVDSWSEALISQELNKREDLLCYVHRVRDENVSALLR